MAPADTLVAGVVRNATSVARSDTSLVTAPKGHTEEVTVVARVDTVEGTEAVLVKGRLATHAEGSDTCLGTAHKARNATTVGALY